MRIHPYIAFDGQCEAALQFYVQCLGAKIEMMETFEGSPMEDSMEDSTKDKWKDRIIHAEFRVGDHLILASDGMPGQYEPMEGIALSINVDSLKDAERVFAAMSENGKVEMPLSSTFWSPGFGMVRDQFGIRWMVNADS